MKPERAFRSHQNVNPQGLTRMALILAVLGLATSQVVDASEPRDTLKAELGLARDIKAARVIARVSREFVERNPRKVAVATRAASVELRNRVKYQKSGEAFAIVLSDIIDAYMTEYPALDRRWRRSIYIIRRALPGTLSHNRIVLQRLFRILNRANIKHGGTSEDEGYIKKALYPQIAK